MKGNRFFYLYLAGGTIALLLMIYQVFANRGLIRIVADGIVAGAFYYLAFKVYHEKKDHDMM
ncbi:MAG TPA: hypothetical protein VHB54_19145 [Mucilaginibacter sp.]|nr:hypothetical protein [Mucilaginibacter sp.]